MDTDAEERGICCGGIMEKTGMNLPQRRHGETGMNPPAGAYVEIRLQRGQIYVVE